MIYDDSGYIGSVDAWIEFLDFWQKEIADFYGDKNAFDYKSKPIARPCELTNFGRLPKSYVDFISAGGLNFLPILSRSEEGGRQFFDLDKVVRLKDSPEFEYWINGNTEDYARSTEDLINENYFRYTPHQIAFRTEDYESLILVGCETTYSAYLLNPAHMDPNGEWEAWNWVTEPTRLPSFAHLVAQIYCFDLHSMNKSIDFSLYWNKAWEEPMRKIIRRTWEWDESIA